MLKAGDRVRIDSTNEVGVVRAVHPHDVLVRVSIPGAHEERKFAYEDLRIDPTMTEASDFIDH